MLRHLLFLKKSCLGKKRDNVWIEFPWKQKKKGSDSRLFMTGKKPKVKKGWFRIGQIENQSDIESPGFLADWRMK